VAADLASLVGGNDVRTTDLNTLSVEDSKFLGGDVDHTHLVKGLDYALLQKVPPPPLLPSPIDLPPDSGAATGCRHMQIIHYYQTSISG
jgi:hypothetical protein